LNCRVSASLVLVSFLFSLAGCASLQAKKARPADLTIFFSSDTRGMLRRCGCSDGQLGGVSARANYIKFNRVAGRTLVLDAGDTLFDGLSVDPAKRDFYMLKSRTLLSAMKQAGYDAAQVGEYDFAYGPGFLAEASRESGFDFLAANVVADTGDNRALSFKPAVVKQFQGFSVGVLGVLDSGFPYKDFPESFGGVTVYDAAASARDSINGLRGKADIIIVLAHMSVDPVEGLAKAVPDADIIIQGHSQEVLEEPVRVGNTIIVKGFNKGKHIGRLDIWLGDKKPGGNGRKVEKVDYSVIALDESLPADPEVEKIIAGYRQELKSRKFVFDEPGPEGAGGFAGSDACKSCHAEQYKNWSATRHAGSYQSLVKTGDQYDPECLPCHTTGYGYKTGYIIGSEQTLRAVGCESCHGRAAMHISGIMAGHTSAMAGTVRRAVGEDTCRGCHDDYNSPRFEYERYKAMGGAHRGGGNK